MFRVNRPQRLQAEDFTILVTLVQGLELVDEGDGTVSFKSFVTEIENGERNRFKRVRKKLSTSTY